MSFDRIPAELRAYHQWLVWLYVTVEGLEKPTKVPYNAKTGQKADVTNSGDWCSFDDAVRASVGYSGIGFCLTERDPYFFGDLDHTDNPEYIKLQTQIFEKLDSYSEFSPGGKGLHIICRGSIPHGRKQHSVEIYSSGRFMTMTGNVFANKPIAPRQDIIDILYHQMSRGKDGTFREFESQPPTETEQEILDKGAAATHNGEKFKNLWHGQWQQYYSSQSEADFAFIDMLANYTDSKEQVFQIFMGSWLGQREKAKKRARDYVIPMINRAYDRKLPAVTFNVDPSRYMNKHTNGATVPGGMEGANPATVAPPVLAGNDEHFPATTEQTTQADYVVNEPTGLIGQFSSFIYWQAFHQNKEMALMAGILLMAGIAGRQYNVDGAGLNLYAVLIAETTMGKEAMASGISKLLASVRRTVPGIGDFVGPDEIASGPALLKHLEKQPCCFTTMGEFGLLLNSMYGDHVPPYLMTLRRTLLNVYSKSGRDNVLGKTIYSDKDKAINEIYEPAFSILGESTPGTFYKMLDESFVAEGLAARLFVIEVRGDRSELNRQRISTPSPQLVLDLGSFAAYVMGNKKAGVIIDVRWQEDARQLEMAFSKNVNAIINNRKLELNSSLRDLWGRSTLTIMKLAALFAVSDSYTNPIITPKHWIDAQGLVERAITNIVGRFQKGEVGSAKPEDSQLDRMKKELSLVIDGAHVPESFGVTPLMLKNSVIPYGWFQKKLQHTKEFSPSREIRTTFKDHGTAAVKRCLETLCDEGILQKLTTNEATAKYLTAALLYRVVRKPE